MPETYDALELLTTREAAAIARVDVSTVNKWVRRENLPAVQREPRTLIDREDLEQFLQQRKPLTQATSPEPEAATGTPSHDDQPGELAQERSGEADEESQRAEEVQDPARLLTCKEAAAIAQVHPDTVSRWVRQKNLPAVQQEPQIMIDPEALEQFLRQRTPPTQTAARVHDATTDDEGGASRFLATHKAADIRDSKPLAQAASAEHEAMTDDPGEASPLLTTQEAAVIAEVRPQRVRKWVARGRLRAVQRRPKMLIDPEDLKQFLHIRKSPVQTVSPGHEPLIDEAMETSRLLTTREAAAIAKVHVSTVNKWVRRENLPAVQREPRTLIDREDLEQFLQQRKSSTQAASPEQEAVTGTPSHDDQPGELAQERSGEADEERQGAEEVQAPVRLLTVQEAADNAKVHPRTVHKWVASRNLRTVQREPHILIDPEVLEHFLHNRTRLTQAASVAHEPLTDDAGEASRLLTAKKAADIAKVDVSTLRKWVRQGNLQAVQRQPLVLVDPETLDQFLSQRTPPAQTVSPEREPAIDAADAPAQGDLVLLDVLPMPTADTPNDAMWRALVLVLQRELEATKARELRLLDLLDQATKPPPPPPRRRIVSEMTVVHRIKEHLEAVGRPQRAWQIQKALKLDKIPYRDLSRLVARGEVQRVSEGVYTAID